jgi:hypothetical protein
MTPNDILKLAQSQIGVFESPPNSNNVKYNTEYYGKPVNDPSLAWCCAFIWWLFKEDGAPALFYGGNKTASCTTLMNYHKSKGQEVKDYKPGDLAFFNWKGQKNVAQHIGIIESVKPGAVVTIEGNTSVANDTNGGTVMRRERSNSLIVCVIRPAYSEKSNKERFKDRLMANGEDFSANTWAYLDAYKYADALYERLAEMK